MTQFYHRHERMYGLNTTLTSGGVSRRAHLLLVGLGATVAVLAAVPVVAFEIVPLFVRHTLVEPPPTAVPAAAVPTNLDGSPPPAPLVLTGMLRRVDSV